VCLRLRRRRLRRRRLRRRRLRRRRLRLRRDRRYSQADSGQRLLHVGCDGAHASGATEGCGPLRAAQCSKLRGFDLLKQWAAPALKPQRLCSERSAHADGKLK
jgi:hypothetical protein